MAHAEARLERTSHTLARNVEQKQAAVTGQRSHHPTPQNQPKQPTITEHDVRLRAYELYLQRGATPGDDLADWLQAERELRSN